MAKRIYAKNKRQLSAFIGVGQQALANLFLRNDHPGQVRGQGYNITQWQRYADNNVAHWRNQNNGSKARGDMINAREQALIRKNQVAADREQFKLDTERGKYWVRADVAELINRYAGTLWRELEKALVHELPPRDEGLSAGDIAKIHRQRIKAIRSSVDKILVIA